MEFLPEEIERYSETFTAPESQVLAEINRETYAQVLMPRMLAGHLQGRVISMLSHMIKPKCVLEIGTYTGYSAICWAEGLAEGGIVHTIEVNDELETRIRRYLKLAELQDRVTLHIGNAARLIGTIEGGFDVVYIDADKENYSNYFDLCIDRVTQGGYIIADNVLWSGKVTEPEEGMDIETKALKDYAVKIAQDERVEQVLLPVRDGLLIARKL